MTTPASAPPGGPPAGATNGRTGSRSLVAWVLMCVQAGVAILLGIYLWTAGRRGRARFAHRFLHDQLSAHAHRWGVVLLVAVAVLLVVAIAIARFRAWAWIVAYVLEAVIALGALVRFHPVRSVIGAGMAVAIIVLLATDPVRPSADRREMEVP